MNLASFPGCCTANVFHTFANESEIIIYNELKKAKRNGLAIITVTLTHHQDAMYRKLKKIGFKFTRPVSKIHHPENKLRLGWFLLEDLK